MRNSVILVIVLFALVAPVTVLAQSTTPQIASVAPETSTKGVEITATGENLGKDSVSALYLTDGTADLKVVISEQTATTIKFKIPANAKDGRFALMVLTKDKPPKLIELPVKITVETPGTGTAPSN